MGKKEMELIEKMDDQINHPVDGLVVKVNKLILVKRDWEKLRKTATNAFIYAIIGAVVAYFVTQNGIKNEGSEGNTNTINHHKHTLEADSLRNDR